VGNRGNFLSELIEHISKITEVDQRYVISTDPNQVSDKTIMQELKTYAQLTRNRFCIIYVGGETRLKKRMMFYNYYLPKKLIISAGQGCVKFIYLSSLAALSGKLIGQISPLSLELPDKRNYYGVTKRLFDDWVRHYNKDSLIFFNIFPASILGRTHQNSSLQQLVSIIRRSRLLRLFELPGWISFCERKDLFNMISKCLFLDVGRSEIVAHNVKISDVQRAINGKAGLIIFPSLVKLISVLRLVMPWVLFKPVRSLFNEAVYVSADGYKSVLDSKSISPFIKSSSVGLSR
jgi:hypothetical protein